jgi:hypothetical protein
MNTEQLIKAQKVWGWAMEITLEDGKIFVAKDGFITDNFADITAKKHYGEFRGYYYQFQSKRNTSDLINVIRSISDSTFCEQEVTA